MKILYVDILSPIGHKNYNYELLDILSMFGTVDTAFKKNYLLDYKNVNNNVNNIHDIPEKLLPTSFSNKKGPVYKILYRINLYRAMKWIDTLVKEKTYDIVIFGGIEIISFVLATKRLKNRYVFVDHAITYLNRNKIKAFFWRHINRNAEAIVMEEFIKDYLVKDLKIENKIWLLNHPLPKINTEEFKDVCDTEKLIFAPSESNDEVFISYLINNYEKITDFKVIIKSKIHTFIADNLEVYKERLSEEKYYGLMAKSDYILLPYDSSYNYRISGVFFEAVVFNKKCIINGENTLNFYAKKYPESVLPYKDYKDFFSLLTKVQNFNNEHELSRFKSDYSQNSLEKQIKLILKKEKRKK